MTNHITIRRATGTWVVRAGGAVLGESKAALELTEGDYPPVIYFPQADLAMAFLEKTDYETRCPHKGTASHYAIVTKSKTLQDAAWCYEAPINEVVQIKDHVAFYPSEDLAVEQL
ncbi:MAG: DUF427 domain-containing protein [Rhodobacteraceae bacterium]|nr:DUF427 domain-containing protein [Paracoccaceae bacterium]